MKIKGFRSWCQHIKQDDGGFWTNLFDVNGVSYVPDKFKFCPVCGAKKPKTRKTK